MPFLEARLATCCWNWPSGWVSISCEQKLPLTLTSSKGHWALICSLRRAIIFFFYFCKALLKSVWPGFCLQYPSHHMVLIIWVKQLKSRGHYVGQWWLDGGTVEPWSTETCQHLLEYEWEMLWPLLISVECFCSDELFGYYDSMKQYGLQISCKITEKLNCCVDSSFYWAS